MDEAAIKLRDQTLASEVASKLALTFATAEKLVLDVERLYMGRMTTRFTNLRFRERLKRTNPFLLQVRGVITVHQWATNQVMSSLFASEEEAIGHVLEMIAKICHPTAAEPVIADDWDFEIVTPEKVVGYQIKMSWDCMPMSSRRNLSNTTRRMRDHYSKTNQQFDGIFAPCYGRATTTKLPGQDYISLRSRDFWAEVGSGDEDYDFKVGEVCKLLCSEFRAELTETLIPDLVERLSREGEAVFGDGEGGIDFRRLFREINR